MQLSPSAIDVIRKQPAEVPVVLVNAIENRSDVDQTRNDFQRLDIEIPVAGKNPNLVVLVGQLLLRQVLARTGIYDHTVVNKQIARMAATSIPLADAGRNVGTLARIKSLGCDRAAIDMDNAAVAAISAADAPSAADAGGVITACRRDRAAIDRQRAAIAVMSAADAGALFAACRNNDAAVDRHVKTIPPTRDIDATARATTDASGFTSANGRNRTAIDRQGSIARLTVGRADARAIVAVAFGAGCRDNASVDDQATEPFKPIIVFSGGSDARRMGAADCGQCACAVTDRQPVDHERIRGRIRADELDSGIVRGRAPHRQRRAVAKDETDIAVDRHASIQSHVVRDIIPAVAPNDCHIRTLDLLAGSASHLTIGSAAINSVAAYRLFRIVGDEAGGPDGHRIVRVQRSEQHRIRHRQREIIDVRHGDSASQHIAAND